MATMLWEIAERSVPHISVCEIERSWRLLWFLSVWARSTTKVLPCKSMTLLAVLLDACLCMAMSQLPPEIFHVTFIQGRALTDASKALCAAAKSAPLVTLDKAAYYHFWPVWGTDQHFFLNTYVGLHTLHLRQPSQSKKKSKKLNKKYTS